MFSLKSMPSTTSVLSTYTTFTASVMLVRSVINEVKTVTRQLIPQQLQDMIISKLGGHFSGNLSSQMTLIIDESNGYTVNHIYEAAEIYLRTKINASVERLKVSKGQRDKKLSLTINKGEKIIDIFEGIQLKWEMTCHETKEPSQGRKLGGQINVCSIEKSVKKAMELSFHKKYMDKVLSSYLPYVMERSNAIKEENKVVKLYALGNFYGDREGAWGSTNLDHPSTFDTLAMDPTLKKELLDDLDRFVRRRNYYRRVGKAWKRGYLLYGPPGTGKSSLVAAMANYLKFNIFDLELASLHSNSELRRLLVSTTNRSILVIEDIDCSVEMQNRHAGGSNNNSRSQLTLSGLLNFIDGLWSSCGDERIIVFTTNHKDKLDPALLRPGRMDMHIHMSYCTPSGFKVLASNYLGIINHNLFVQIDQMLTEVEVTPAEIAEELMKNEDAHIALRGLINFLQRKKTEYSESSDEGNEQEKQDISEVWTKVGNKRRATREIAGIDKAKRARNLNPRPPIKFIEQEELEI